MILSTTVCVIRVAADRSFGAAFEKLSATAR